MYLKYLLSIITCFSIINLNAQDENKNISQLNPKIKFRAIAELGYLAALSHKIQFSQDGTYYDYVKDGGQGCSFPF